MAFNVVHAAPTLVARLVAAIPPAALVLSFELLMRQLRAALAPRAESEFPADSQLADAAASVKIPPPRDTPLTTSASPLLEQARVIYATRRQSQERVTGSVLAHELGISDGYGRRLLRQLAIDDSSAAA